MCTVTRVQARDRILRISSKIVYPREDGMAGKMDDGREEVWLTAVQPSRCIGASKVKGNNPQRHCLPYRSRVHKEDARSCEKPGRLACNRYYKQTSKQANRDRAVIVVFLPTVVISANHKSQCATSVLYNHPRRKLATAIPVSATLWHSQHNKCRGLILRSFEKHSDFQHFGSDFKYISYLKVPHRSSRHGPLTFTI